MAVLVSFKSAVVCGEQLDETLLGGLRVLELADELGEYCGRRLAALGADVVKIEPPGGEASRHYGPFVDDIVDPENSLYFLALQLRETQCPV